MRRNAAAGRPSFCYLAFNTQQKPFDDAKVRQALNLAIDKRALVDAVFAGAGVVAKNPLPPTVWSYDDSAGDDAYDPEGAKKLLDEAGIKDLKLKLWAMPVARSQSGATSPVVETKSWRPVEDPPRKPSASLMLRATRGAM